MATTSPSILRTEGKTSACMGLVSENICAAGWAARVGSRPWVVRAPWEQASQAPELCLPHMSYPGRRPPAPQPTWYASFSSCLCTAPAM